MSDPLSAVRIKIMPDAIRAIAVEPPAWTRLEPQSVTGDPTPGLEARVHDPLWLLARQWQFGEFRGEDAGTPLGVKLDVSSQRATAWQPGDPSANSPARPFSGNEALDPTVEREPHAGDGPGLRYRAEAGSLLVAVLAEAGFDGRAALLAMCRFPVDVPRLFQTLARAMPDGESAAVALEAGSPSWLAGAPAAALDAVQEWLAWYRRNVSPPAALASDSWIGERIEYRFSVRVGAGATQRVLTAPLHEGGAIDWYSFDYAPERELAVGGEDVALEPAARTVTAMASPVRYTGMPADRLWQFEDGSVNFGKLEVQRYDLARLCFVEFAMIHGNDWFVVPLDAEVGSITTVTRLEYTTTFGDRFVVPPTDDRGRSGRFRLFGLSTIGSDETLEGFFVPPATRGTLEGRSLEEVLLLRDETANMAWAVEAIVQDAAGDPRSRRDEPRADNPPSPPAPPAELRYLLATDVPRHWIPLVPIATSGRGGFILRKGTMTDEDESLGQLLDPTPLNLHEEEVPREGVRVRRVPALIRAADGHCVRWIARRVSVGRGEGSSGLAFDTAAST
jgi:hypothetical protein